MAIADKLQTVAFGVIDVRIALNEFDSSLGSGHINTLDDDIRSIYRATIVFMQNPDRIVRSVNSGTTVSALCNNSNISISDVKKVIIKNEMTSIGSSCFENCTNLISVNIPTSITSINNNAFNNCTKLPSITIPSSVTSIGTNAFKNCSNLINFTNLSTALISAQTNDAWSCGNGTGIFETYGDVKRIGSQNINFKQIIIHGNLDNNSGYYLSRSSTLEIIKIGGNLTASTSKGAVNALLNTYDSESNLKFIEVGGTITGYPIQNGSGSSYIGSNCIFHLKYNGIACTPSQIELDRGGTRVSKVYVDSQSVLNQYLANSDWATYSSKLDLWSNYTGTYKS